MVIGIKHRHNKYEEDDYYSDIKNRVFEHEIKINEQSVTIFIKKPCEFCWYNKAIEDVQKERKRSL